MKNHFFFKDYRVVCRLAIPSHSSADVRFEESRDSSPLDGDLISMHHRVQHVSTIYEDFLSEEASQCSKTELQTQKETKPEKVIIYYDFPVFPVLKNWKQKLQFVADFLSLQLYTVLRSIKCCWCRHLLLPSWVCWKTESPKGHNHHLLKTDKWTFKNSQNHVLIKILPLQEKVSVSWLTAFSFRAQQHQTKNISKISPDVSRTSDVNIWHILLNYCCLIAEDICVCSSEMFIACLLSCLFYVVVQGW